MARKTKAELNAEREEASALQEAHDFAAYPSRLMAALELATTKNNYELEVRNGMFSLRDRDERDSTLSLTMVHTRNSLYALETLEWDMERKEAAREEAKRLQEVRRAAFAKLSKEEQTALGLNDRNNW